MREGTFQGYELKAMALEHALLLCLKTSDFRVLGGSRKRI